LNSRQDYRVKTNVVGMTQDHKELLRRTWVLFMLNLRRECDGETITSQAEELGSFLKRHLDSEERKMDFSTEGNIGTASGTIQDNEVFLGLVRYMHELQPLSVKWNEAFESFETKLCQHVGGRDGIHYLPSSKVWQNEHEHVENEQRLLAA